MITKAVIQILLSNAGITSLVNNRVEPSILKQQATYPSIYVSSDRMEKLSCVKDSGIRTGTLEVGVYANTYVETGQIVEAIRAALDDYQGTQSGVGIHIMRGKDTGDQYDDQEKKHVKVIEYDAVAQINN